MDSTEAQAPSTDRAALLDTIQALRSTLQDLRARTEKLEAEREELLKENRSLRREITQSRLIADLKTSTAVLEDGSASSVVAHPTAEHLYQTLPSSFTYEEYFQIAENKGLDVDEARRALRAFLVEDLVAQEGPRLRKERVDTSSAETRAPIPFSRLAA